MSFTAQEQLAEGNITRDVQDRGRSKIVQLEAIVLQKPSEERMDWKSDTSQQVGNKAYSFPMDGLGKFSTCAPSSKEANPARTETRSARGDSPVSGVGSAEDEARSSSANRLLEGHGGAKKSLEH